MSMVHLNLNSQQISNPPSDIGPLKKVPSAKYRGILRVPKVLRRTKYLPITCQQDRETAPPAKLNVLRKEQDPSNFFKDFSRISPVIKFSKSWIQNESAGTTRSLHGHCEPVLSRHHCASSLSSHAFTELRIPRGSALSTSPLLLLPTQLISGPIDT